MVTKTTNDRGTHPRYPKTGATLQRHREARALTQSALAEAAKVNGSYLCQVEGGWVKPGPRFRARVCEALGLDPAVLWDAIQCDERGEKA